MRRSLLAAATIAATVGALVPAVLSVASAADSTTVPAAASASVLLPTGDAVRLGTANGHPHVSVVAAERSGVTAAFAQMTVGGHSFVFPAEARPFLGGVLDPSLFDATALAAASRSGRIPVTLNHAPGAAVHVPGLVVTSHTATTARGYLASTGTSAFRAALVSAWQAVAQPGARAPKALFGGVTHLAAVGATPQAVTPDYPQVTLVIKVLDASGDPASGGLVGLINTDSTAKFINFVFYQDGEARVSVPYGNYSAITDVAAFNRHSGVFTDRVLPVADFSVVKNMQHLTIDARDATVVPSVQTPRPASLVVESVEFDREARDGGSLGSSFIFDARSRVFVAPTHQARVGSLEWLTGDTLVSDSGSGTPYSYDLSFADIGSVPADQAETVQPYQLTTVDSRYYNDKPRHSQFVRAPIYPFQFGVFSLFLPLDTPVQRTEYVYGGSNAIWTASLIADPSGANPFGGFVDDDFRVYSEGSRLSADWLRGPLASAPPEQTSGDSFYTCPGCRSTDRMSVLLAPFTDTTPGHFGDVSDPENGPATKFALYRGDTKIAGGPDFIGALVDVPPVAATYRLHLAVDRSADHPLTSTSSITDLTFQSSASDSAPLPHGWFCDAGNSCSVLTLLKATVPLPTDLSDRLPAGTSSFVMTIAPFHGAGSATITSAKVLTKVDGGLYHPAALDRLGNGRYRVTLDNPADTAGKAVTIRVLAADDKGDSISQTTNNAYLVATS